MMMLCGRGCAREEKYSVNEAVLYCILYLYSVGTHVILFHIFESFVCAHRWLSVPPRLYSNDNNNNIMQ